MKKSVIIFSVACAAYGATLLAIGIFLLRFNLSELFVEMLAEKLNFLGLVLAIGLYLPIMMMRFIPHCFMLYGAGYCLFCAQTLYRLHKRDIPWLHSRLRILRIVHGCLMALVLIADAVIIAYLVNDVSVLLIVFTVLFNVTSIAFGIANFISVKKLKQNLI